MNSRIKLSCTMLSALIVAGFTVFSQAANAAYIVGPNTISSDTSHETWSYFGSQTNFTTSFAPGGVCAAVAAINSFVFLEHQYPTTYGNSLTPNYNSATNTDYQDTLAFAYTYYTMPAITLVDGMNNYVREKLNWFNAYAPNTTRIDSWYFGSAQNNMAPTVSSLLKEIQDGEDVELFVRNNSGSFYHALTLTGVFHDSVLGWGIWYKDPNDPTDEKSSILGFDGTYLTIGGDLLPTEGVSILAEFSESPVPEIDLHTAGGGIAFLSALFSLALERRRFSRMV